MFAEINTPEAEMNLARHNLPRLQVSEQQSGAEDPFTRRDENEGRAGSVTRHHSPFEGLMNESPRLCRGMVTGKNIFTTDYLLKKYFNNVIM